MKRAFLLLVAALGLGACSAFDFFQPPRPIEASLVSREIASTISAFETSSEAPFGRKIVGGKRVTIGDNPWQASLIVSYIADPFMGAFCGGSVIASQWVLTAGHCVDRGTRTSLVHVVTGTDDLRKGGVRSNVDAIYLHPSYRSPEGSGFDFALLHLQAPVTAQPIQLVTVAQETGLALDDKYADPQVIQVTGHGRTSEGGQPSAELLGVEIPNVPREMCNLEASYGGDIKENMFCAGYTDKDSCQGDSGGPATIKIHGASALLGVTSWGDGCARRFKFGVYARVTTAEQWIRDTMQKRVGGK